MLRKALATLPPTLDQTYDRILCAISEADSKYAMRILRWLVCSIRPLCVEEVAEAVAIDTSRSPAFDPDEILEDPLDVLSICGGLVTLTTTSKSDLYDRPFNSQRIVALAHYSVQEYLVSDQIRQGEAKRYSLKADAGHNAITQDCLHYLLQFQQPNMRPSDIIDKFALSRYSATFMQYHIQRAKHKIKQSNRLVLDFFSSANPAYENWIQLHDHLEICDDGRLSVEGCAMPRPLSCAAITAMRRVVEILLDAGAKVNEDHESVLQAAVIGEHEEIVKMLLDKGANVNDTFPGDRYDNVLHAAIWGYNENMVKMLLDAGADPNAQSGYYGNVLQYAVCECVKGDDIIVKLLLGKGANVNAQGGHFGYALQAGSWFGHEPIVELLLDEGAKVNAQGGEYGNALQAASHNGHERIVKTLLDKGAKVNAQGGRYGNALQAASSEGHGEIVEILLRKGARVNAQGGKQGNALQAAIVGGHEQVVKMLIEAGAENKETIVTAPIT
jgi:ankyrin repeat protein